MNRLKVLFLASNPVDTKLLRLDEEARTILEKIRLSEYRDAVQFTPILAVRADDLLQSFNQHEPQIAHFSGHGTKTGEILLVDAQGKSKPVSQVALVQLFKTFRNSLRLVLLNACYSESQAKAISEVVDMVIGMSSKLNDRTAILFAASFYRAIAFGKSVQSAFDQGKLSLLLEGVKDQDLPVILHRPEINPDDIVLVTPSFDPIKTQSSIDQISISTRLATRRSNYIDTILTKYEEWLQLYTPMAGLVEPVGKLSKMRLRVTPAAIEPLYELIGERQSQLGGSISQVAYNTTDVVPEIKRRKRVALLGEPGAGKSYTLWRLVADIAKEAKSNTDTSLPLLISLRDYVGPEPFVQYVEDFLYKNYSDIFEEFPKLLSDQRLALFLDGLNEMPRVDYEDRVARLKTFLSSNPNLLVVVTCREFDYTVNLGLDKIRISPLDPIRIKTFLKKYLDEEGEVLFWKMCDRRVTMDFWPRFKKGGGTEYDFWIAKEMPPSVTTPWFSWDWDYWMHHRDNPRSLLVLAKNPYMLFMIANIYASRLDLPTNRGQLIRLFVDTLINKEAVRPEKYDQGLNAEEQFRHLSVLAFAMQQDDKPSVSMDLEIATKLLQGSKMLQFAVNENILRVNDRVSFSHQLLQEFFAAYGLDQARIKGTSADTFWPSEGWWKPTGWEESAILMTGLNYDNPIPIIDWLGYTNPELTARCVTSSGIQVPQETMQRMISVWLPRLTDSKETIAARAAIGRALGLVDGDIRPGVCVVEKGMPVIEWCKLPSGEFFMGHGEAVRKYFLDEFWFSKYLITNAQYDVFLSDRGYTDRWRSCWTDVGWEQKSDSYGPQDYTETIMLPNHPRIGISWYEAVAFCSWLTIKMASAGLLPKNFVIRLPTEREWEKAARGTDGWPYPWGHEFDHKKCNVVDLESTTAVGLFPEGASTYGIRDMIGNAWKWCLTKWNDKIHSEEDNDPNGSYKRVYRGGSWGSNKWRADWTYDELHCGLRHWNDPEDNRPDAVGFFIVMASKIN